MRMLNDLSASLSGWIIPLLFLLIIVVGWCRGVAIYQVFVEGAAEGFQTAVKIMPYLVAMIVAIDVFRISGALDGLVEGIKPFLLLSGIPADLIPLAIMRPLSGTGALGMVSEILLEYGPDSLNGKIAATALASTDTTFYILTVYFGGVGITNPRYSVGVGLLGDIVGFLGSVYVCQHLFS